VHTHLRAISWCQSQFRLYVFHPRWQRCLVFQLCSDSVLELTSLNCIAASSRTCVLSKRRFINAGLRQYETVSRDLHQCGRVAEWVLLKELYQWTVAARCLDGHCESVNDLGILNICADWVVCKLSCQCKRMDSNKILKIALNHNLELVGTWHREYSRKRWNILTFFKLVRAKTTACPTVWQGYWSIVLRVWQKLVKQFIGMKLVSHILWADCDERCSRARILHYYCECNLRVPRKALIADGVLQGNRIALDICHVTRTDRQLVVIAWRGNYGRICWNCPSFGFAYIEVARWVLLEIRR